MRVPNVGTKSEVAASTLPSWGPTCGQNGYITPTASGLQRVFGVSRLLLFFWPRALLICVWARELRQRKIRHSRFFVTYILEKKMLVTYSQFTQLTLFVHSTYIQKNNTALVVANPIIHAFEWQCPS